MARLKINANPRYQSGKGIAKRLREAGQVPGVVYGKQIDNLQQPLVLDKRELRKFLQQLTANALVDLVIEKENSENEKHTVMVREVQKDFINGELLHVDFFRVNMSNTMQATVPVVLIGEPAGIKEGGILQHTLRDIEVRCLPDQIPEYVEVNIDALGIGDSVQVSEIDLGDEVELLTSLEITVASVLAPQMPEEDEEEDDELLEDGEVPVIGEEEDEEPEA